MVEPVCRPSHHPAPGVDRLAGRRVRIASTRTPGQSQSGGPNRTHPHSPRPLHPGRQGQPPGTTGAACTTWMPHRRRSGSIPQTHHQSLHVGHAGTIVETGCYYPPTSILQPTDSAAARPPASPDVVNPQLQRHLSRKRMGGAAKAWVVGAEGHLHSVQNPFAETCPPESWPGCFPDRNGDRRIVVGGAHDQVGLRTIPLSSVTKWCVRVPRGASTIPTPSWGVGGDVAHVRVGDLGSVVSSSNRSAA